MKLSATLTLSPSPQRSGKSNGQPASPTNTPPITPRLINGPGSATKPARAVQRVTVSFTVGIGSSGWNSVDDAQHRLVKRGHIVDFAAATCPCGHYRINKIPRGHAVALLRKLCIHPHDFMPDFFPVTTYRNTYWASLRLMDCTELPSSVDCLQPILRKLRGRPKERRLRKAARQRRTCAVHVAEAAEVPDITSQHYAQCGGIVHNRRTCKEYRYL
ncbi:hypothetical protein FN846DRAFT_1002189 [Sphaerosporella brunnea]|uniref:SWIM-type domain-containing protein n=1 Tax=Sphaerosporella brunnea TaxID=1250544 RepID=A0A5J5EEG3_9PEZI|nr:hypothetical protein FN846DRAFT_1002189 [Sphaerosporella brunnea]